MALKDEMKKQFDRVATLWTNPVQAVALYQTENMQQEHQVEQVAVKNGDADEGVYNPFSVEQVADLKETMHQDYDVAQHSATLVEIDDSQRAVLALLQTSVSPQTSSQDTNETFMVGNWRGTQCNFYEIRVRSQDKSLTRAEQLSFQQQRIELARVASNLSASTERVVPEQVDRLIDRSKMRVVYNERDPEHEDALAYFSLQTQEIVLHKYLPYEQNLGMTMYDAYKRGDPIFQASILLHENVHEDHCFYDGAEQLCKLPINAAKKDRLTETEACTVQYLHAAHQYTLLREQGVDTLQVFYDFSLPQILNDYQSIDEQNRPDLEEYLRASGVDQLHTIEEKSIGDILDDYDAMPAENRPLLTDYLKGRGINTLQVEERNTLHDVLDGYVNWTGVGERPDFDDYINSFGDDVKVYDGHTYYSLSEFMDEQGISDVARQGGDILGKVSDCGQYEVIIPVSKRVDDLSEILNQKGATIEDIVERSGIDTSKDYYITDNKPIEDVIQKWPSIQKELEEGGDIDSVLRGYDLGSSYVSFPQNVPVESILEYFPGLKEVIDEHGFDVNNPQSVRRVVEAASRYWHEERMSAYDFQAMGHVRAGSYYFSSRSWSEQLELLQNEKGDYLKISENMLKDVYIGHNTTVDLSGCRDLLDTMSDEDAMELVNSYNNYYATKASYVVMAPTLSFDEMKEINDYLENKGLVTDEQKMEYMTTFLHNIGYRCGENNDPELTQIILKHCPKIVYQDGVSVQYDEAGMACVQLKNMELAVDIPQDMLERPISVDGAAAIEGQSQLIQMPQKARNYSR